MSQDDNLDNDAEIDEIRSDIEKASPSNKERLRDAFITAALGSIPWVGGFIAAIAEFKMQEGDIAKDNLQSRWLEEHGKKISNLNETLAYILERFESIGDSIEERIESEEYLALVRKAFRVWDKADTNEKRKYVADLVANASSYQLASDEVIRLFIQWIDIYHEAHFAVIGVIFKNPGVTRYQIWTFINGNIPREDSAEADLFKMLIRDLSTGGVIRQERAITSGGQFLKSSRKSTKSSSGVMQSAFEDTKPYVLTALGEQFVHYTMTELVPRMKE